MKILAPVLVLATLGLGACTPPPAPAPTPPPPAPAPVSGIDVAHFDASVNPQDDFFTYVNGLWLAKTEIPADRGAYGSFFVLRDESERNLRQIVDEISTNSSRSSGEEERKLAALYASFMDEARVESLGLNPLKDALARIDALGDKSQLPALFAYLERLGVGVWFRSFVNQDAKDSSRYIVHLTQSGLGLPDRDYYLLPDRKFRDLRRAYRQHVERTLTLAGDAEAAAHAERILMLETRLAARQWTKVEDRDRDKTYNKVEVAALAEQFPGFDWNSYLQAARYGGQGEVIVRQPGYLRSLGTMLQTYSLDSHKLYLRWQLLRAMSPYLPKAFVDEHFDFFGKTLNGVPENRPRWKRAIAVVEEHLGEALGKLYVARHFPPGHKARMQKLVANLTEAYRQSFQSLEWMSEPTRQRALEKLASFSPKIGYPDVWRDYSALHIDVADLAGNIFAGHAFEFDRNRAKLGKPVDRNEWGMTPQTVNAYYNAGKNEIVFPAAILQPPFFNIAADDAVNYGAIGAVIGHEIGHGFDDQGSKYDAAGNLNSWWTKDDRKKFEARAKKLIEQYDGYEPLPGEHINGALSVGENLADLGGVTIGYRAWQLSLGGKPAPVMDGLGGDQRFFIGWAQAWRTKYREATLLNQLKVGPHSPAQYRCNGVLANLPQFHAAFGIEPGDAMHRSEKQRVNVW